MSLYTMSGISVESWVEMEPGIPMRHEVDRLNGNVTLYFGQHGDYVLTLCRDSLDHLVELGTKAQAQLAAKDTEK